MVHALLSGRADICMETYDPIKMLAVKRRNGSDVCTVPSTVLRASSYTLVCAPSSRMSLWNCRGVPACEMVYVHRVALVNTVSTRTNIRIHIHVNAYVEVYTKDLAVTLRYNYTLGDVTRVQTPSVIPFPLLLPCSPET